MSLVRVRAESPVRAAVAAMLVAGWVTTLHGQSFAPVAVSVPPPSSSLSGAVRDESNQLVQATVTIATQGLRQSAPTAPDGSFAFSNLKTGMYVVCAVPPPGTTSRRFVDSCLWQDRNSLKVPLAPGQNRQGIVVPMKHGYPLPIRVNDNAGLLPTPIGTTGGNDLAIHVIGPSGLAQPVPITGRDAKGRDHLLIVPYDAPLQLLIHSSTFVLKDANGKDLKATTAVSFTAAFSGQGQSFVVNVDRPIP